VYDPYAPVQRPPVETEEERRRRENAWAPLPVPQPPPPTSDDEGMNPVLLNAITQPQRAGASGGQQQDQGIDWLKLLSYFRS
jgi:hypothetical protein